jgi:tetratricopeptide (TPR) repeat protein
MHLSQGNTELANRQAEQAIRANRKSPAAWALRGDILARQGELDKAMASYHRALSLQQHYPHVQLALAEIYQRNGRAQRVLSTLDSLVSQLPPDEIPQHVFYLQGLALKEVQRYDDAVAALSAAIRQHGPGVELLYHLSEAQLLSGDVTNARLAVRAALAHAPAHQPSHRLQDRISQQGHSLR